MDNISLSLDDIIKSKKSKNPERKRRINGKEPLRLVKSKQNDTKSRKNNRKPILKSVKKSNASLFKPSSRRSASVPIPDARLKLSRVQDARLKILKNKNRLTKTRSSLLIGKGAIVDARLKIEEHRQMQHKKLEQRKKPFGITTIGGDGIIERRINGNIVDNEIRVEYEDGDMDLECETFKKENWSGKYLLVRRTIQNNDRWKNPLRDERMSDEGSPPPLFNDSRSFKEVTRTIANQNYKKPSVSVSRRSYSRRSPVRQYNSFDNNRKMRSSRLSPPLHPSPISRDSHYHLIAISNLHENVTGEDIKELFEDVGDLVYAKMIRDGVAEVAYKSHRDAAKAVEIYHNRQLDGLPMKCVLMSGHHDSSSSRNVPPINTFSPVEPDTHLIKKALFSSY